MIKYLNNHVRRVELILRGGKRGTDWQSLRDLHRARTGFLQHERLVHLLITLFFGLVFVLLSVANLFVQIPGILLIEPVLLVLLAAYVWHYYQLENGVQKLYRLDDELSEKIK